jgi:hypothetical protein
LCQSLRARARERERERESERERERERESERERDEGWRSNVHNRAYRRKQLASQTFGDFFGPQMSSSLKPVASLAAIVSAA